MSWFVPMMDAEPVSIEEKRQALARVLESRTFGRSEQLRAFLRYVCEAEFEGRAHELNEYALGVSVLGRSADYSPAADSCVRTRAYELRNKLDSYYRSEAPDDPVRIEIAKGAYVPRFERRFAAIPSAVPPNTVPPSETPPETASIPPAGNRRPFRTRWAVGLLIAAAAVACVLLARSWNGPEREPPKGLAGQSLSKGMRALWKPFLDSSAPLLISFEIRLAFSAPATGLVVRDYRTNRPEDAANSKPLTDFKARMGAN